MSTKELLRMTGISKSFGGIQALDGVDFSLNTGEVHSLMGENGAGKSTLAKIIAGVYRADRGSIDYEGKGVDITSPAVALSLGISIVMQEFNSLPDMPVYENVYLGHQDAYKHRFILDKANCIRRTRELLSLFDIQDQIDPMQRLRTLSVAQQQIVEIIKAVSHDSRLIILDEPTASLTEHEVEKLFDIIRKLKAKGVSFLIVSHRFSEIFSISDRITVLRDGRLVQGGVPVSEMTEQRLVHAMVGREVEDFYGAGKNEPCDVKRAPMLEVKGLDDGWGFLHNISFTAYTGEILGISGLVGAGRTTLVRNIFGIEHRKAGSVRVDGRELPPGSPSASIRNGLALVTENRKEEGLLIELPIYINSAFAKTANDGRFLLDKRSELEDCAEMVRLLDIRTKNVRNASGSLSGGNQQKLVVAKWLLTKPKVLILDEPTRGIDVVAKSEIYGILRRLVRQGVCVIIISSELPEILGVCDRVLVMRDGAFTGDISTAEVNDEDIVRMASFGTPI